MLLEVSKVGLEGYLGFKSTKKECVFLKYFRFRTSVSWPASFIQFYDFFTISCKFFTYFFLNFRIFCILMVGLFWIRSTFANHHMLIGLFKWSMCLSFPLWQYVNSNRILSLHWLFSELLEFNLMTLKAALLIHSITIFWKLSRCVTMVLFIRNLSFCFEGCDLFCYHFFLIFVVFEHSCVFIFNCFDLLVFKIIHHPKNGCFPLDIQLSL